MPKRPERSADASLAIRFRTRLAEEQAQQGMSDAGLAKRVTDLGCPMTAATIWKIKSAQPPRKVDLDEAHAIASALGYGSLAGMVGGDDDKRCRDLVAAVDRDMRSMVLALHETERLVDQFLGLVHRLPPDDNIRLRAEMADSIETTAEAVQLFASVQMFTRVWGGLVGPDDSGVRKMMNAMARARKAQAVAESKRRAEAEEEHLAREGDDGEPSDNDYEPGDHRGSEGDLVW